jgi:hypothetical protein
VENDFQELPPLDEPIPITETLLDNLLISEMEVQDQIKSLNVNKGYGLDDISPLMLKEAGPLVVESLCKIFNKSIEMGKFPSIWKNAKVTPLYKKDDPSNPTNYRPVSILSVISKIFEKIVFKHVYNFMFDNKIISPFQSGFMPGFSTNTQLIEILHHLYEAQSKGHESRIIFLDFSKAFDKVWHDGLKYKLKMNGIAGNLYRWFIDYITNRKQKVVINGQSSTWEHLRGGVPQGSVLGPLLFLLYINDLTQAITSCDIRLFADDTCLIYSGKDSLAMQQALQNDLNKVQLWADKWLMNFSHGKSESLIINRKSHKDNNLTVYLNNDPIKEISHHKHLGIWISNNLSWSYHFDQITLNCGLKLNLMRSLMWRLDRKSLETIYVAFIRPKMEYCDNLFAGAPQVQLNKLKKIEYEAFRIISGAIAKTSSATIFDELQFQSLEDRRNAHTLLFFYKIHSGKAPKYLLDILAGYIRKKLYMTRDCSQYFVPFTRSTNFLNSFFPRTIRIWNEIDPAVRRLDSISQFKLRIQTKLKKNILYYYGQRWANIHHARIRMGCSKLNADLYHNYHVILSPACNCGYHSENANHFFFHCPLYVNQRRIMLRSLHDTGINNPDIDLILYGSVELSEHINIEIFSIVHNFILKTNRF